MPVTHGVTGSSPVRTATLISNEVPRLNASELHFFSVNNGLSRCVSLVDKCGIVF